MLDTQLVIMIDRQLSTRK